MAIGYLDVTDVGYLVVLDLEMAKALL
jgi:hypothetical protein